MCFLCKLEGDQEVPVSAGVVYLMAIPPMCVARVHRRSSKLCWHAGVGLSVALTLGLAIAAALIWQREVLIRRCSLASALGSLRAIHSSSATPSSSVDLKLELDVDGEPWLLGQGSFAKVSLMGRQKIDEARWLDHTCSEHFGPKLLNKQEPLLLGQGSQAKMSSAQHASWVWSTTVRQYRAVSFCGTGTHFAAVWISTIRGTIRALWHVIEDL